MRTGRASRTAQFVAYHRALGTLAPRVPGFSDPLAMDALPEKWQRRIRRTQRALATNPNRSPYPFWVRGMGLFNQFRTVVLDRAINSALPVPQLVILGAGFDTRAWRLPGLEHTTVFEVDHPDTQALKKQRAGKWPAKAREVRFVAADLRHDHLASVLETAGYDKSIPTFWLWEGVAMYLTPSQVAANLAAFGSLSAPGSGLALTYLSKDRGRTPQSLFLALLGEPVRSAFSPDEMTATAAPGGWATVADTGIEDWLRTYTPGLRLTRRQVGMQWFERIRVSEKLS